MATINPKKKEEMANGEPVLVPPAIYPIAALSCPHEYVVRTLENEVAYVALFNLIVEHGVYEKWGRRRYQYWYPGDGWKYWRMTSDIRQSRVLNRARSQSADTDDKPIGAAARQAPRADG